MSKLLKHLLTLAIIVMSGVMFTACDTNEGPTEEFGEGVDEAAEETGEAMEDAADEID